MIKNDVV